MIMTARFKSFFSLKIAFILLLLILFFVFHIKTPDGYTNIFLLGQELDRTSIFEQEAFFANPTQNYCWADIDNLAELDLKSSRDGIEIETGRYGTGSFVYKGRKYSIPDSIVQTEELSELIGILKRNYCNRQIIRCVIYGICWFVVSAVFIFVELLYKQRAKGKYGKYARVNSNRDFIVSGALFSIVTIAHGAICIIRVCMSWNLLPDINRYMNISLCLLGIIIALLMFMKKKCLLLSIVWCLFTLVQVYFGFTNLSVITIGEIIIWIVMAALVIGMQGSSESQFGLFCSRIYSIPVGVFALLTVINNELSYGTTIIRIVSLIAVWVMYRALKTKSIDV